VVFSVRGITDQGQESACAADAKTVEVALEAYYAQYGSTAVPDQAGLVASGLLRSTTANSTINSTGDVIGTGDC
jgi:general secretion pathway protein G